MRGLHGDEFQAGLFLKLLLVHAVAGPVQVGDLFQQGRRVFLLRDIEGEIGGVRLAGEEFLQPVAVEIPLVDFAQAGGVVLVARAKRETSAK